MLKPLFEPNAVAVIGASSKALSIGNRIVKNLVDFGFKGPIYPINPKADEIRGVKAYPSIFDVPGHIDLVHLVIVNKVVPQAVEDCGKKGVKAIIINSAGFKEIGEEGAAIEKDFLARAAKYGIRVLGPNCQGIINTDPEIRAYANFTFTRPDPGYISIVAQSGGVGELIHQGFSEMGVGTRIYASNGNACDISVNEIIDYLGDDEGTRVIAFYVEGLPDPKAFMETAGRVAAKKPILAMKAGRTKEGAKAASSHTGGLAKEDVATELIFEKYGMLTFRDEGELCRAAAAFAAAPIPRGKRVGLITNTGGPAIIATDVLVEAGLEIPPLSPQTAETLREKLYSAAAVSNPIDVLATGTAEHFRASLDALMADDGIDSLYVNFVTPFFVDTESIAREIAEVNRMRIKPIVVNLMTDKRQWTETLAVLKQGGVPCYSFPGDAARALVHLTRYGELQKRERELFQPFSDVDKTRVQNHLHAARTEGRLQLSAAEVYDILAAYQIPVAPWKTAEIPEGAVQAAGELGYPVALKAEAEEIVHKSDMGGVALNLPDAAAVEAAATKMLQNLSGKTDLLRFFVQSHLDGGLEAIAGAKADETGIGHLVMFGMGGIFVEVFNDVVFKIAPVAKTEAAEMVSSVRAAPILAGVRGQEGVDREKLADLIQR